MSWKTDRWLMLDTETTGLDTSTARVVELGWAVFHGGHAMGAGSTLVNPECAIPEHASAVHGIRDVDVADAPILQVAWELMQPYLDSCPVVGAYNWPYDSAILKRQLGLLFVEPFLFPSGAGHLIIDPLIAARAYGRVAWPGQGNGLGPVCERLGIAVPGTLHRAAANAVAAGMVLWALRDSMPDQNVDTWIARERRQQDKERFERAAKREAKP